MIKTWMKFSLGGILLWVYVTVHTWDTVHPSYTIPELFLLNPIYFVGVLIGICLLGIAIGTIPFLIWYLVSGRKIKQMKVVVLKAYENSKALQAGIKDKDVITRVCSKRVKTATDIKEALQKRNRNKLVNIELLRGEKTLTFEISLEQNEKLGLDFK